MLPTNIARQSIFSALLTIASFNVQAATHSNSVFSIQTEAADSSLVGDVFTVNYGTVLRGSYQGMLSHKINTPFTLSVNDGWVVSEIWITINASYDLVFDWNRDWPGGHREVTFMSVSTMAPYEGASVGAGINSGIVRNGNYQSDWGSRERTNAWFAAPGQELEGKNDLSLFSSLYLYTYVGFGSGTLDSVSVRFVTTPVPEPSTYAMLGLGLGVMGFAARRRKYYQ